MVRCIVLECPNMQGKCSGITFHKFPKDEARRQQWIQAVGRKHWTPTSSSFVCSSHFTEENMDRTSLVYVRLRQDAVPSIFNSLPNHLQEDGRLGGKNSSHQGKQGELEEEYQHVEDNVSSQNHMPSLDSTNRTREPTVSSVLLPTIKKEDEAGEQIPVSVLLEWSEVGTSEPALRSPVPATNVDEDCEIEQKPSLADLLEWHNVEDGVNPSGLAVSPSSNCVMPQVQSVTCTPDTPCGVSLKRKSNEQNTKKLKPKRKLPKQKMVRDEVDGEWDQDELGKVGARETTPESLLLECCVEEEETCDSEQASSTGSRCTSPQELLALCVTDNQRTELLKKQLCRTTEKLCVAKKKIRMLMQNRRRFRKRIASYKGTCSELKRKNLQCEDKIKFLEKTLGGSYRELFERRAKTTSALNYSTQLREFATKLYFYSRDAYHYMRQTFQNCLPHPGTLRRWNSPSTDGPELDIPNDEMSSESATESSANGEIMLGIDDTFGESAGISSADTQNSAS